MRVDFVHKKDPKKARGLDGELFSYLGKTGLDGPCCDHDSELHLVDLFGVVGQFVWRLVRLDLIQITGRGFNIRTDQGRMNGLSYPSSRRRTFPVNSDHNPISSINVALRAGFHLDHGQRVRATSRTIISDRHLIVSPNYVAHMLSLINQLKHRSSSIGEN